MTLFLWLKEALTYRDPPRKSAPYPWKKGRNNEDFPGFIDGFCGEMNPYHTLIIHENPPLETIKDNDITKDFLALSTLFLWLNEALKCCNLP